MPLIPNKYSMPTQDARERARNFNEVALGYTPELAKSEAQRCLNCKNRPCVKGCPDRKAACAVTCEKWKRYVEERDKVYKKRVKETERGRP